MINIVIFADSNFNMFVLVIVQRNIVASNAPSILRFDVFDFNYHILEQSED